MNKKRMSSVFIATWISLISYGQDIQVCDSVEQNFDSLETKGLYGQSVWRAESWKNANQNHRIVERAGVDGGTGKCMAMSTGNGFHNLVYLTPRTDGTLICSFDFKPSDGVWTFFGFKKPGAAWNEYQTPLQIAPIHKEGIIQTMKNGKPLILCRGKLSKDKWYKITITAKPNGEPNREGQYRLRVNDDDNNVIVESDYMAFPSSGNAPISMFEIRSVAWSKANTSDSGYIDNLLIRQDEQEPKMRIKSDRLGSLFYYGKPAKLIGDIKAGSKGFAASLAVEVSDSEGRIVFTENKAVMLKAGESIKLEYVVNSEKLIRYGLYNVKLILGDENKFCAFTTLGVIAPSEDIGDNFNSPFGAFEYPLDETLDPDFAPHLPKVVQLMYDLGIRWVRCNMHWYKVESEKGQFNWGVMGDFVDEIYKHKMHAFIELTNTTKWASSIKSDAGGSVDTGKTWQSVAPENFADWEIFCRKTAERFKGRVKFYEVWNEPGAPKNGNSNGFWRDSSDNFIKIIKHAGKAVKAVDPDAKIMVSGFRTVDIGRHFENFAERVFRGAIDDIDIVSFHHWTEGGWSTKIYDFKILMRAYGKTRPYWNTEAGGSGKTANDIKLFFWSWSAGCEKVFPFIFNLPRYPEHSLVNADFSPNEGTITFATMTRLLAGFQPEGQVDAGPGIRAFSFTDGKRRIVVAWSEVDGKNMTATVLGAESVMDYQGNLTKTEIKKGIYNKNSMEIGCKPTYIFCNLDGLDINPNQ